jgi:hypothetical protein
MKSDTLSQVIQEFTREAMTMFIAQVMIGFDASGSNLQFQFKNFK